jgi:hypothetical protein
MNPVRIPVGRIVCFLLAFPCALAPASALASSFSFMGYDAESGAVANSNLSFGTSMGVLHTNPALLAGARSQVGLNLLFNLPVLDVTLMEKDRYTNVPISIYDSTIGNVPGLQDRALPTAELPTKSGNTEVRDFNAYLGLGIAHNFGIKNFQIGLLALLPISSWNSAEISTHYNDEREANFSNRLHFTRAGQWNRIAAAVAGAAYEPAPWFSFGVAGEVTLSTKLRLTLYIPDATVQDYSLSSARTEVASGVRPIAGVRFRPLDWLAFGVVWRNESYVSVDGGGQLLLWNYHEPSPDKTIPKRTAQTFPLVLEYEPLEVAVGAGASFKGFTTQAAVTWQQWSQYLDHHAQHPQSYAEFPPSPFADPDNGGLIKAEDYRFDNTFNFQWSGQYRYRPWGEASLGVGWHPTPVPPQLGRTNYVDNDLLGISLGHKFDFEIARRSFTAALNFQVWTMFERTTHKDRDQVYDEFPDGARTLLANNPMSEAAGLQTNNLGYPGFEAGGMMYAGGASFIHNF